MGLRSAWHRYRRSPVSVQSTDSGPDGNWQSFEFEEPYEYAVDSETQAQRAQEAGYKVRKDGDRTGFDWYIITGATEYDCCALELHITPVAWVFEPFSESPTIWWLEREPPAWKSPFV